MKEHFRYLCIIPVIIVIVFIACKKEKSCEGCKGNKPPIAIAGPDQVITLPADSSLLDGSASNDPDGMISEWLWKKISGPATFNVINSSLSKTIVTNLVAGVYQFELKVTDDKGSSANDTMQVIVDAVITTNHPPVANAGADQTITLPANTITLNGSASTDPDNNINSYAWSKISGPSSYNILNGNAVQTQVTNLAQGVYQFELKVADAGGLFSRDTIQAMITSQPPPSTINCEPTNRPIINAQLIPVGNLSSGRRHMATVSADNKLFFAGGHERSGAASTRVDIYNALSQTWSTAELSVPRTLLSAGAAGDKVFFAGGLAASGLSSRVDIYDIATQTWSIAELSQARTLIETATVGNKVFFAGGQGSSRVDIYDLSTNTWSVANLSEAKFGFTATVADNKIYFAGGYINDGIPTSTKIDIYDNATGSWSTSTLSTPRAYHAAIFNNGKIYWAGGSTLTDVNGDCCDSLTCNVEIKDINTQISSFSNLSYPKCVSIAFEKNNKIGFLGLPLGSNFNIGCQCIQHFDVYDLSSNSWSVGVFPQIVSSCASILSVNNTIYIASHDRQVNCDYIFYVWKLEF